MEASGESVSSVSDPRVQAALERIADSAGIDLNAMPDVLEDVYRRLNSALADNPANGQVSANGQVAANGQGLTEGQQNESSLDSDLPPGSAPDIR